MLVPDDWMEAADSIIRDRIERLVIVGPVDAGKSTLSRFLIAEAARAGHSAALLDCDVGQKTVGPPACVTIAGESSTGLAFVGATDAFRGWHRQIEGTRRLARSNKADLLVTNTSGVLAGLGRRLKAGKFAAIEPDLLIGIGEDRDLDAILREHAEIPALRLARPPEARRKSTSDRRRARREGFRSYFAGALSATVERSRLEPTRGNAPLSPGLLIGFADVRGNHVGMGIIVAFPTPDTIQVLTPISATRVHRVMPGSLFLDQAFAERAPPQD